MNLSHSAGRPSRYGNILSSSDRVAQIHSTEHDHESGLVYDQVEVRGPSAVERGWISNLKTPQIARTRQLHNNGQGARSLAEIALNKASSLSQELSVEALQNLPFPLGQMLWDKIVEDHLESFQTWRVFATAYGEEFANPQNRYMLEIKSPVLDHTTYYQGLNSKSLSWITCLRISPKATRVADLVGLSSIGNLGVLDLSDGQLYMETRTSTFDQRVLRSWVELARDRRAFRHLRVLMLGWQEKVSSWIFDYLDSFPKLNLFVTTACAFIDHKNHRDWEQQAWDRGWEFMPSKRGVKHLRKLLSDNTVYAVNISSLYYESFRLSEAEDHFPMRNSEHPVLECWLGAPRSWSHVTDDFPGTKTVVFQRRTTGLNATKSIEGLKTPFAAMERVSNIEGTTVFSARSQSGIRRKPKQSAADLLAQMG